MKKLRYGLFVLVFCLICLVPSVGMLVAGVSETSESGTEIAFPSLVTEEGLNREFFSEVGDWFESSFAFRENLVTAYNLIAGKVFGTSAEDKVIVGENDWLYYTDSLSDYQGTDLMTERQLFDAAHTLAMIQTYANENSVEFIFTIAPNKASLYGENMPYYYSLFCEEENNLSGFLGWLEQEGVNYVDLYETFLAQDEVLYHARDSHWNNKGAALAADVLLSALNLEHRSYENADYEIRKDYVGDLDEMIYPLAVTPEEEIYYEPEPQFTYVTEVESNYSAKIYTEGAGSGSLVMYRDSFCNALLPFLAESFETAYFSRTEPYKITNDLSACEATVLIIERAERFIPDIAKNAPFMVAPLVLEESAYLMTYTADISDLSVGEQGDYTRISGTLKEGS